MLLTKGGGVELLTKRTGVGAGEGVLEQPHESNSTSDAVSAKPSASVSPVQITMMELLAYDLRRSTGRFL